VNRLATLIPPAAIALALAAPLPAWGGQAGPAPMTCTAVSFPVTLEPGAGSVVTGQECSRGDAAGRPLIVAEPGGTYGSQYWAWPADPARYSFAWGATLAGFRVLALDRPGTPPRDTPYPPAADVSITTDAAALHQVLVALGAPARSVILAGHSIGALVAITEAATWHDPAVAGLVVTAALHPESPAGVAQLTADAIPVQDDPALSSDGMPAGYLTTAPGTRGQLFYQAGDSAPAIVAQDEATKTAVSEAELAGIPAAENPALSRQVTVPVLIEVGQDDLINCGPGLPCGTAGQVLAREEGDYAAPPAVFVLPGAGHDLTTAANGLAATAAAVAWALAVIASLSQTRQARTSAPASRLNGRARGLVTSYRTRAPARRRSPDPRMPCPTTTPRSTRNGGRPVRRPTSSGPRCRTKSASSMPGAGRHTKRTMPAAAAWKSESRPASRAPSKH